ncbi:MAG: hypothetical protein MK132_26720 [Lentisphaerales bacterium]|nr:hypothetical protein [Lentisphaerales bacterium]
MKIPKILLTIALVFSSFFPLAASIRTLDFQQKPHLGHFSEFSSDAHLATVVYLLETQKGTQLVWCTMHIDPTDNMVNGFSEGEAYSSGMSYRSGLLVQSYGVDKYGLTDGISFPLAPASQNLPTNVSSRGYSFRVAYVDSDSGHAFFRADFTFKLDVSWFGIWNCNVDYKMEIVEWAKVQLNKYYDIHAPVTMHDGTKYSMLSHEMRHVNDFTQALTDIKEFMKDYETICCPCKNKFEVYINKYVEYKKAEISYLNDQFDFEQYSLPRVHTSKPLYKKAEQEYFDAKFDYLECLAD